jgi:tetratricopeptide (TPR) repeat protein
MAAALGGHAEVLRELADAGADLSAKDRRGWTALTHAASSTKTEAVKMLVDRGAGASVEERALLLGSTYVNAYYVSNDAGLLSLAAAEFERVLDRDPSNAPALLWMGAVDYLRWDPAPTREQFRRASAMLRKSAGLGSDDPVLQYWVAAVNSIFVTRSKSLERKEAADILDEGIEFGRKAVMLDPEYSSAMAYLRVLYAQRADRADSPAERERFANLSEAAAQDVLRSGNRPPRPNDQFSRPSPPAAPSLPVVSR